MKTLHQRGHFLCSSTFLSFFLLVLALRAYGASYVVAWGDNSFGQADVPPGLTNVIGVAGNSYNSFALRSDGSVVGWGANLYGLTNVPQSLTNATAISAYYTHALGLRSDGTVVVWGSGYYGESSIPIGLTNVIAVAAGAYHNVALRSNGTVAGWGYNCCGETNAPAALTNALGIAAGNSLTLAINNEGQLVTWGSPIYPGVPSDLTNVAAVAAGDGHVVAVQGNGIVRAWGGGNAGLTTNVPPNLTNATAVAASSRHNLAIRADRTLVGWGANDYSQITVPPGLTNVLAIAAGPNHSLAVVQVNDGSPVVVRHPASTSLASGFPVTICAAAEGEPAPSCQWQFNGQDMPGATDRCLTFLAAQSTNTGTYRAVFSNPHGMTTSLDAALTVTNAPPLILSQPQAQVAFAGTTVTLAVSVTGSLPLTYQWRLNGTPLPDATNASVVLTNVQLTNEGYYWLAVTNAWGIAASSNVFLNVVGLEDALNTNLVWITSGDAAWFPENQYSGYLTPAARSGVITNNQASLLETTVSGPGTLWFDWKVSSQPTLDYLSFSINGVEQKRISGTANWRTETFFLGAGPQQLRWAYAKGPSGSAGQDAGWVDWVSYEPRVTLPTITTQPIHQAFVPGSNFTFSVSAYGTPPLSYQWQLNGAPLSGATGTALTVLNAQAADVGTYRVIVSNPYGSVPSTDGSLFSFVGPALPQDALDRWYLRSTNRLNRVRYAGGLFFGLGANGVLLTSPDGAVWTARNSGTTASLYGVACGLVISPWPHNQFVAVGEGKILTSRDAVSWTVVSPSSQAFHDVAWNGSRFVATTTAYSSGQANVYYSANGTNWTGATFPGNPDTGFPFATTAISTSGSYFLTAGGSQFAYYIWRSATGSTWQNVGFSDQVVEGIASDSGRSLMVGWEGWPRVSTNQGASWFASVSGVIAPTNYQQGYVAPMVGSDVAFGNGTFLVARGFCQNGFLTTTDGVNWAQRARFSGAVVDSVAFGNGTFVLACSGGSYPVGIYQSAPAATPMIGNALQTNPKKLVLNISGEVGRAYRLQTSPDLHTWSDCRSYTNTAPVMQFLESVPSVSTQLFYRVVSP